MELRFLGSGDAFGSGGRFNTCIHVRDRKGAFLVDCGASSLVAIKKFAVDPNKVRAILISHLHGDHFGGLPFFILDGQLMSRREAPLVIAGPPELGDRLAAAMEVFFPGSSKARRRFPLEIRELEGGRAHEVAGIEVTPYPVEHFSGAPSFALRVAVDQKTLCYSGDTEWTEGLAAAAKDVDLLIAESYFLAKRVKYHLDFATLASHLPQLGAKRVILTHMSNEMLLHAGEVGCERAEDGMAIVL
jgi:ribonuclease BN (tRNA processing enzyme)